MHPYRPRPDLPTEILDLFLNRVTFVDHAHFGAVCRSWRSAASRSPHHGALQLPWLMLPPQDPTTHTWGLFTPAETHFVQHVDLLVSPGAWCVGSSCGWLLISDPALGNHLLNPFSHARLPFPHASTIPLEKERPRDKAWVSSPAYFHKAILSSRPAPNTNAAADCVVVAIYKWERLAFCRPRDECWHHFPGLESDCSIQDIVFCNGLLYVLNKMKNIEIFKFGPEPPIKKSYHPDPPAEKRISIARTYYLVESRGKLFMVIRYWDFPGPSVNDGHNSNEDFIPGTITTGFDIYKLSLEGTKWVEVKSLGDEVLCIGIGCSKLFMAANGSGFRRNSIYFTEDGFDEFSLMYEGPIAFDWGVFSFDDRSIRPFYMNDPQCATCPCLWFMLNCG